MATERPSHLKASRHVEMCINTETKPKLITVFIQPTTGGEIKLQVSPISKISSLKSVISNKLKLPRDKIVLLQKNLQLVDGTLEDNQVLDGAKLILVPCVEAGLLSLRPEHSVLKALNTLTDTQVDNVLMGRVPLNLTMRLGGHMMFIQLQLATVTPPPPLNSPINKSLKKDTLAVNLSSTTGLPTPPHTPTSAASFTLPPPSGPHLPPSPPDSPQADSESSKSPPKWSPPLQQQQQHGGVSSPSSINSANKSSLLTCQSHHRETVATPPASPVRSPPYQELAEASRNLTQTLKQISSAALGSNRPPEKCDIRSCPRQATSATTMQQNGAVIESLYHHGKGIYSGTFVGTLNPSLQDLDGRPRQNISTIVHILNDLLGASLSCHPSCCGHAATPNNNTQTNPQTQTKQKSESDTEKCQENQAIRGKIEQIQSMMEERRQRRKARREVRSCPYNTTNTESSTIANSVPNGINPVANSSPRATATTNSSSLDGSLHHDLLTFDV